MDTDTFPIQKIVSALSEHQLEAIKFLRAVEKIFLSNSKTHERYEDKAAIQQFDLAIQLIENTNSVLKSLETAIDPLSGVNRKTLEEVVTLEVVRKSFRADADSIEPVSQDSFPATQPIDIFNPIEPNQS